MARPEVRRAWGNESHPGRRHALRSSGRGTRPCCLNIKTGALSSCADGAYWKELAAPLLQPGPPSQQVSTIEWHLSQRNDPRSSRKRPPQTGQAGRLRRRGSSLASSAVLRGRVLSGLRAMWVWCPSRRARSARRVGFSGRRMTNGSPASAEADPTARRTSRTSSWPLRCPGEPPRHRPIAKACGSPCRSTARCILRWD